MDDANRVSVARSGGSAVNRERSPIANFWENFSPGVRGANGQKRAGDRFHRTRKDCKFAKTPSLPPPIRSRAGSGRNKFSFFLCVLCGFIYHEKHKRDTKCTKKNVHFVPGYSISAVCPALVIGLVVPPLVPPTKVCYSLCSQFETSSGMCRADEIREYDDKL